MAEDDDPDVFRPSEGGVFMTRIATLLARIRTTPDCVVHGPSGAPRVDPTEALPVDLASFYALCGGGSLFASTDYGVDVVAPSDVVRANPVIRGADDENDLSHSWYVVARTGGGQCITIDCHPERLGRCYDGFWDSHAIRGSSPVIALSFEELLTRLLESRGERWYWLEPGWVGYGDAYDTR